MASVSKSQQCNVHVSGRPGGPVLMFVHGYGCDQNMWRYLVPSFVRDYQVVLLDLIGAGNSDLAGCDAERYGSLHGYSADLIEICDELDLSEVTVVGHSVAAMIAGLATIASPGRFKALVMLAPSPCYLNEEGYSGGFSTDDVEELLVMIDANYLGWSTAMAPRIMGRPDRPELGTELTESFCRTDPAIAQQFARVTFQSDHRADLAHMHLPTLILQCSDDIIAPVEVGAFMKAAMPNATLVVMDATGHCPHLSEPAATVHEIQSYLSKR